MKGLLTSVEVIGKLIKAIYTNIENDVNDDAKYHAKHNISNLIHHIAYYSVDYTSAKELKENIGKKVSFNPILDLVNNSDCVTTVLHFGKKDKINKIHNNTIEYFDSISEHIYKNSNINEYDNLEINLWKFGDNLMVSHNLELDNFNQLKSSKFIIENDDEVFCFAGGAAFDDSHIIDYFGLHWKLLSRYKEEDPEYFEELLENLEFEEDEIIKNKGKNIEYLKLYKNVLDIFQENFLSSSYTDAKIFQKALDKELKLRSIIENNKQNTKYCLEYIFDNSNKFYNLEISNLTINIEYGKIGVKNPKKIEYIFDNEEDMNKKLIQLIKSKLKKGYSFK